MNASEGQTPRIERQSPFPIRIALPAFAILGVLAVLLASVVLLSATQANQVAADRQQELVSTVIQQNITNTAHDQEGVTIWDDAVIQLHKPELDMAWLDGNVGVWLHGYYGHDEVYIVNARDTPLYAMRGGERVSVSSYAAKARPATQPLIDQLRAKLNKPWSEGDLGPSVRTPGAVDLGMVDGHPSIISVKPIVPDTDQGLQKRGEEYLHISVRHLDGKFAALLARQYQIDGARFSLSAPSDPAERAVPLKTGAGEVLGYLVWKPFGPGAMMIQRMAIPALAAFLLVLTMVAWLIQRIRRSTLQLQASEAQAQHLAFHDALTGLANRALFDERLAQAIGDSLRRNRSVALLYFDLDRFKNVNDTLGHPAGDELICAMARRLVDVTRSTDFVARIGGDEFAVIQTDIASPAEVEILCMRIVEAVSEPFDLLGNKVSVGVSIGVALSPYDATDRTEITRKADIALYEAKASGRGRYVFFAEAMDATIRNRREIERDLRAAMQDKSQLEVVYQPLYSAQSSRITGAEALVRWHHPTRGPLAPSCFIPIAEATGLIEEIGEWVLEQACTAASGWPILSVSVNVSTVQLRNEKFAERVLAILARTGLEPSRLELEITETSFLESAATCQPNLARLRARGVQVALDDFGTGYSSFSHLRAFDIDRIKIDQSFVQGIDARGGGSAIIQAIVDLAKASGMQVTAEGVETVEQGQFLKKAGCNSLQGYLLSSPLSSARFGALMRVSNKDMAPPRGERLTAVR